MQRGSIYRERNFWYVRYRETQIRNGVPVRVRIAKKLAPVGREFPTVRSVWPLAEKIIAPVNDKRLQPASSQSVSDFIKNVYLPHVKNELRPSTHKDYNDIYRVHLKNRLDIRLRDFRTVHGQRLMREITGIRHTSLLRVKSFLSGVFKHARREGIIDSENPMRDVSVPGRPVKFRGAVYSMEEIVAISEQVRKVDMQAFTVIAVAAFAGLRLSELRGLKWADYNANSLKISRSVWRTHVGPTKTESSANSVPVLPVLAKILDEHRVRVNGNSEDYIFAGPRRGTPLNLANLVRRVIQPALASYEGEDELSWKGWHAFRRSLGTNLYSCGVAPKVIQEILRHSSVSTTLSIYVQPPDTEARAALQKIEDLLSEA